MLGASARTLGRVALGSLAVLSMVRATCNNLCSGHGDCSAEAQCDCYENWMGADCSQRVCGYSKAYVNSPFGDINGDGKIDMRVNRREEDKAWMTEAYNIEYGLGRGDVDGKKEWRQWDEGHFYAECGSVGICDRDTGICDCFPGYSGDACQRTACPGRIDGETIRDTVVCNGHGRCVPAYEGLEGNYNLWDADSTTKCTCDAWYTGVDCSLRKCPHGIDPIGSTDRSHNRVQKITFPAYDITLDATTAPDDDFRSHVNGYVKFALTTTDVYGDEWTTALNTFIYRTNCTDITNKDCSTAPWFDQDLLDAYDTDPTSLYPESLLADQVNQTLQALPTDTFPSGDMYVWMDYPQYNFQYPSEDYESDDTQYFNSPYTRWPDFTNSEALECGGTLDHVSIVGVDAWEGLCLFVRSPYLTEEDELLQVRFAYHDGVTDLDTNTNPLSAQQQKEWTGTSSTLTRDTTTLVSEVDTFGSGLLSTEFPFVTVEEVGKFRFWDTTVDGYPERVFAKPLVAECSNRGLCDQYTGDCACLDGYSGRACDYQDTIIDLGIVSF